MAGTLTISTLSDGTNSTSSTNCIQGSAKAWVSWNSVGTIGAAYNVNSITKNATGDYTINFTNALADSNYTLAFACQTDSSNGAQASIVGLRATNGSIDTKTSSAFRVQIKNQSWSFVDENFTSVAVFR